MLSLFLSPKGLLRRTEFIVALVVFAIYIFLFERLSGLADFSMTSFLISGFAFCLLIYSVYQVCKKRLHDMGFTARPFWIVLFVLFILWIGAAIYFGVGEHFNSMFEYEDQFRLGEITEEQRNELIKSREALLTENLAKAAGPTRIVLTIPAALFLIWLAATPGKQKDA